MGGFRPGPPTVGDTGLGLESGSSNEHENRHDEDRHDEENDQLFGGDGLDFESDLINEDENISNKGNVQLRFLHLYHPGREALSTGISESFFCSSYPILAFTIDL